MSENRIEFASETSVARECAIVAALALPITALCAAFSAWLLSAAPRANVPFWVEAVIAMGWGTGWLLSLSAVSIRWVVMDYCSEMWQGRIAAAHVVQVPFVIVGVGIWVVLKLHSTL